MRFRIKYADQIVGSFVMIALLAIAGMMVLIGANQRWFAKNYTFKASFPSGAGVSPGTAIQMKGFQIGKITSIVLNDQNEVDAELVIYDTYYPKVRVNSILELSTSLIGMGSSLLFHPGRSDIILDEGSFIPRMDSPTGQALIEQELVEIPPKDDTITRLLANVNPLIENVNKTIVTVNRTLTEINRAIAGQSAGPLGSIVTDASSITSSVVRTAGDIEGLASGLQGTIDQVIAKLENTVDQLMAEIQGITGQVTGITGQVGGILGQVDVVMNSVEGIAGNVEATTEAIRDPTGLVPRLLDPQGSLKTLLDDDNVLFQRIEAMIAEVQRTLKNLTDISASLKTEMPKIATLLNETRTALQQAQDVLEGVKNNPLISGGVPERQSQQGLFEGLRDEGGF